MMSRQTTLRSVLIAFFCLSHLAVAQIDDSHVLFVTGTAAPDDNGIFDRVNQVRISESGKIAFSANLSQTVGGFDDDRGIFLLDVNRSLQQLFRDGTLVPSGDGRFNDPGEFDINTLGRMAVTSRLKDTFDGSNQNEALFEFDGGIIDETLRTGDSFAGLVLDEPRAPQLNNAGDIAFLCNGDVAGVSIGTALPQSGTTETLLATRGQPSIDGNGIVEDVGFPSLNELGQVALAVELEQTFSGSLDDSAVLFYDGNTLSVVVREGQSTPNGDGQLSFLNAPTINDNSDIVFGSNIRNSSMPGFASGLFRLRNAALETIARTGDLAPDGIREFTIVSSQVAISNSGDIVFLALLESPSPEIDFSAFLFDGDSLTEIVTNNQPIPDQPGVLFGFRDFVINESSQLAFIGEFDSGGVVVGMYFEDEAVGLKEIARVGDPLMGSEIANIAFPDITADGDVFFWFFLADGRSGFALAPEPPLLGDLNLDRVVDLLDVQPFVDQLSDPSQFQIEADINEDGVINLLDVGPFVALLQK